MSDGRSDKETALVNAIAEINEDDALAIVRQLLATGTEPLRILEFSRQAMDIIGERYDCGEYFLPELIIAGDLLGQIANLVKPLLAQSATSKAAEQKVIIGTVAGDLHDIGKNIVVLMLEVNGFKVIDLGVDVSVQRFLDAIREHQPAVVGMSGFLTMAFDSMKKTIAAIDQAGLRGQLKIMIGGGQVDEVVRGYTGADAFGDNAMAAVNLCQGWVGKAV